MFYCNEQGFFWNIVEFQWYFKGTKVFECLKQMLVLVKNLQARMFWDIPALNFDSLVNAQKTHKNIFNFVFKKYTLRWDSSIKFEPISFQCEKKNKTGNKHTLIYNLPFHDSSS